MLPQYIFKTLPELGWAIFVAVATVIATELVTFNESTLTDPAAWGMALLAACVRAAAGALLAHFGPGGFSDGTGGTTAHPND